MQFKSIKAINKTYQFNIDNFVRAVQILGVTTDEIKNEQLKINYSNVTLNSTHQRNNTHTKYNIN